MIKVLGENYYIDLDVIENYIDMSDNKTYDDDNDDVSDSTTQEVKVNLIKFELIKMMLDTILSEGEEIDDKLGIKSMGGATIPFKIAFNTLLNKKIINHY
jgi:short-subunit dehydrogenase involved in D-alanine esterification of teichoic acids